MISSENMHREVQQILSDVKAGAELTVEMAEKLDEARKYYSVQDPKGSVICTDQRIPIEPLAIIPAGLVRKAEIVSMRAWQERQQRKKPAKDRRLHDEQLLRQCTFHILETEGDIPRLNGKVRDLYKYAHPKRPDIDRTDKLLQQVLNEEREKYAERQQRKSVRQSLNNEK
jgi:hypothetical protein